MKEPRKKHLYLSLTHFGQDNETGDDISAPETGAYHGDADRENTGANTEADASKGSEGEFEELIKGRYATAFASRVQKIIDKRFRQSKILEAKAEEDKLFRERVAVLCGGDSPEAETLLEKIEELTKERASKAPDDAKISKMEERARKVYPDFDAKREMANEAFSRYVGLGLDFSEAYVLTHLESIKSDAQKKGAREAVLSIESMGKRPSEGSVSTSRPVSHRKIGDLDSAEIKKLIERASKGEKIKFKDI